MTKSRNILPKRFDWTPERLQLLRERYADTVTAELARVLGCTSSAVYSKANVMGLHKGEAFQATGAGGRILNGGKLGVANQFKPGEKPWNIGKSYRPGGRSAETQFKPGSKPKNYKPVGSLTITRNGLLARKEHDTGNQLHDWIPVHRLVWIAAKGPIPPGHVVVFKPGRRTTELEKITPDALECISRVELMARNTVHAVYPPELARVVQLRGALARQINKREKGKKP